MRLWDTSAVGFIGADFMGAMGAIAHTAKMSWGRCPKSPHRTFVVIIERVKCAVKYEFIIRSVTKVAQISA